jgi:hypothetical protein
MRGLSSIAFGLAAASALALAPSLASAAGAPKPSQIVSARAESAICPFDPPFPFKSTSYRLDKMSVGGAPDVAFSVPPKTVLVITSARLGFAGPIAGTTQVVYLLSYDESGSAATLGTALATAQSSQVSQVALEFPTGAVVRSGHTVCVWTNEGATSAEINGYFTKDR